MKLGLNFIAVWFGIIMILVVVGGAIAITFTDVLSDRLFGLKRTFFVLMLIAYAIYRGFRLYHLINQKKYRED